MEFKRYGVAGLGNETTPEQEKKFRATIDAKGWKFIALVDPGYTIFEVVQNLPDDEMKQLVADSFPGVITIGVPVDYPSA
ncbi:hypothetical protein [Nocardia tengchongensis]|uniref:hypothetical protein n=1 Tax=Nocardia tengchongensis TaxID=2055889 RepID=UPI003695D12C